MWSFTQVLKFLMRARCPRGCEASGWWRETESRARPPASPSQRPGPVHQEPRALVTDHSPVTPECHHYIVMTWGHHTPGRDHRHKWPVITMTQTVIPHLSLMLHWSGFYSGPWCQIIQRLPDSDKWPVTAQINDNGLFESDFCTTKYKNPQG